MKILVVSPFLPYPGVAHAGGKLVFYLLQTLVRNHTVFLVSRYYPGEERHFGELKKMLSGLELVHAPGPVDAGRLLSVWNTVLSYIRLAREARQMLTSERFDLCQVEFTETGVFWSPAGDVPSVLTCHDVIAKPAFRRFEAAGGILKARQWCKWKTMRMMEKKAVGKFARVFTLSDEDREWGERLYPGVSFKVLRYPGGIGFAGLPQKEVPGRILFLGALNRPQNVESVRYFWERVWPAVRERAPDSEFRVAGSGLPGDLEREMSEDPRVVFAGFVENVEREYKSASVFIAPILAGGGVIVKILDALTAGVPVVTTNYGNEGIGAKPGEEILIADDEEDFANAVLSLLDDADNRKRIGFAGKRFAEEKFHGDGFANVLERTYAEISSC